MLKKVKLGELASVKGGKRLPKGINLITEPNSHPYIRVRDLNNRSTLELNDDFEYVDDETQKSIARYIVESGDIVLSIVGTIGLVAVVGESLHKANLTENCVKLTQLDGVDRDYLYYFLKSDLGQAEIAKGTVGAVQAKLPIKNIQAIDVVLPEIATQQKISRILRSVDDKIENNQNINDNLLKQLDALYIEFSQREQWEMTSVEEIAEKVAMGPFGSNIKVSTFVPSGVPIISGNHLRGYFLEEPSYNYITEEHANRLKNSLVHSKDIVFTHAGNIGQVAMIPNGSEYSTYVLSQRQFYLRCDTSKVCPEYVNLFFHSKEGQHELLSYANQTGVPSIAQPATNLKKIKFPLPPMEAQREWITLVEPIIDLYQLNYQEIKRLSSLRDSLLPKLMSGELDVSNIEL